MRIYKILWDNGHASGALHGAFTNRRTAERTAAAWKRDMVSIEPDAAARAAARAAYSWDVIEVQPGDPGYPDEPKAS